MKTSTLDASTCQKARLARDPRFDGVFFTAVKTTGIYCRCICPATPPKESNVEYFADAVQAAHAGYRPCLRCRPDSAPHSPAWQGNKTTFHRAIRLINEGALHSGNLTELGDRLGISGRYLRQLFTQNIGVSPKVYALYQQSLFAKQLLHETHLSITDIAFASGFQSVRRFNDCFKLHMALTPSAVRKRQPSVARTLCLKLYYRPPYDWDFMLGFLDARCIDDLEWRTKKRYGRTLQYQTTIGYFEVEPDPSRHCVLVYVQLNQWQHLMQIVASIRRLFDLDTQDAELQRGLSPLLGSAGGYHAGIRLPGIWDSFEAGVRAILGQQVSVTAAKNLVTQLVDQLGAPLPCDLMPQMHSKTITPKKLFPTAQALGADPLNFLRIPGARKNTLRSFAQWWLDRKDNSWDSLIEIKGMGPWTVNYIRLRGLSDPDIFLDSDLGVKKVLKSYALTIPPKMASPWGSYLTLQLWHKLSQ